MSMTMHIMWSILLASHVAFNSVLVSPLLSHIYIVPSVSLSFILVYILSIRIWKLHIPILSCAFHLHFNI